MKVYKYSSGSWSQLGSNINGVAVGDTFGYSTSLSDDGTILAVGAPDISSLDPDSDNNGPGAASVYQYSSGSWSQLGSTINGVDTQDLFGRSVSLSGNGQIFAIGGDGHDGDENGSGRGVARIYEYASGSWSQLGSDIEGPTAQSESSSGSRLGRDLSLSDDGSTIAITLSNEADKVYQYASGSWSQLGGNLIAENVAFGYNAAISDDGTRVTFSISGSFATFKYSSNTWANIASVTVPRSEGWTSDTSNDGSIVAVGSYMVSEDSDNSYAKIYKIEIEN